MRLPTNARELAVMANRIKELCMESSGERAGNYNRWRSLYLHGSDDGTEARVNKIKPIIDRLASFLYASESITFWLQLQADDMDQDAYNQIEAMIDLLEDQWHDTGLDLEVSHAVKWGLVYGAVILCILPQPTNDPQEVNVVGHFVLPHNFGVWREDQPDLLKQEAVCMRTYLSMPEILRMYEGDSNLRAIIHGLEQGNEGSGNQSQAWVTGGDLVNTAGSGFSGDPRTYGGRVDYQPRTADPLYEAYELYVYDDELRDFRLLTLIGGFVARNVPLSATGIPGRFPFSKVCPYPAPDYFWGYSRVEDVARLQSWYTMRVDQMDQLFEKILRPPKVMIGIGGMMEDKQAALNEPGGFFPISNPNAKVEEFKPEIPDSAFTMLESIDGEFTEQSGLRPSMMGKQEPGTRTEGMMANTMRVAAAEVRSTALIVERQVEDAAALLLRYLCRYDASKLIDDTGALFLIADFPEARVKVDGHSSSPLFVEDHAQQAQGLFRVGAIDQETVVDMIKPGMKGLIKHRLQRVLFAKMVGAAKAKAEQDMKRSGKGASGG
jgi:hypothetical protein